jgi:small subunit ribosomal protein S8
MVDFLSDMLTRIRNGHRARLDAVTLHPYSPKKCISVLEILRDEGFIRGFKEWYDSESNVKYIKVLLKYNGVGAPVIRGIFVVSRPGRRVYLSTKALWKPKNTAGIFLISTPAGIKTDRDARLFNLGGEILCGIY